MRDAKISLSDKHLKQMQDAEDKMYEVLAQTIDKAIQEGEIPKIHTLLSAHAFVALLYVGDYKDVDQNPLIPDIEDLAQQIVDFYWNGLSNYDCFLIIFSTIFSFIYFKKSALHFQALFLIDNNSFR